MDSPRRFLFLVVLTACVFQPAHAEIEWDAKTIGIEAIHGQTTAEFAFSFKNRGKTVARILSVEPSCHCIEATASESHIAPSAAGKLKVILTIGTTGQTAEGNIKATIEQDGRRTVHLLEMTAKSSAIISFPEPRLVWQREDQEPTKAMMGRLMSGFPVEQFRIESRNPNFSAQLAPSGTEGRVILAVTARDMTRAQSGMVRIVAQTPTGPESAYVFLDIK